MADHDAEMDRLVAMLEEAGLVEQYTNDDGKPALRLTDRGRQLGTAIAMSGDKEATVELVDALKSPTKIAEVHAY